MMKRICQRQLALLGHVMRRHGLENLVVTRRIEGERARGHQRLMYFDSVCTSQNNNVSPTQFIRALEDRELWHHMVVNVVIDGTAS